MISPGIEISLEALAARAARLPRVDIEEPRHAIGKGTEEAIQAGVVYGFAGQVDAILGRIREELGEEATAIATGGFAERDRPVLRAGRRGRRQAHASGSQADLGAQSS